MVCTEVPLHQRGINLFWSVMATGHFFQDLPCCPHNLVPAAIGQSNIEIIRIVLPGCLFCPGDDRDEIIREERPVPDHPDPDPVPVNSFIGYHPIEPVLEEVKQVFYLFPLAGEVLGRERIQRDVLYPQVMGPFKHLLGAICSRTMPFLPYKSA